MLQTSYEAKTKDLWVFIETKDGKARNVGLELLNPGRRLAGIQGGQTVALVIGYNCDDAVKEAIAHGADKVMVLDNEVYDHYSTDAYTAAIVECVKNNCPTTILMGASPMGRDLGPRVAGRLKTGLTADCTHLDVDVEKYAAFLKEASTLPQAQLDALNREDLPPDRYLPSWREQEAGG